MAIRIPIISEFDDRGLARATRQFKDLETTGQKAQFAIQKAAVPAALALGGLAVAAGAAFNAFAEDAAAADKLALSLKNTTGATDAQIAATEEFIAQTSRAAAVADDQLRPALDSLVRGTRDVEKSQQLLGLALDISAGTGKDLQTVTDALSKAYNGNYKALRTLDPTLTKLIKDGASADSIFASLGQTFGGQAAAQANTAAGQMRGLTIQMDELKESVGAAVAPIVSALLPAFANIAEWIANNTPLVIGLGVAVAGLAGAIVTMNVAMTAWKAAAALAAAMNAVLGTSFTALWIATGVGIIIAIVAAVVALQAKFQFMDNVIAGLKVGFQAFWNVVSNIFGWIADKVQAVASLIWNAFKIHIDFVIAYFEFWYGLVSKIVEKVIAVFKGAAEMIGGIIKGIAQGFVTAFVSAINGLIELINKAIRAYNRIPLAPNLPTIPKLGIPELADGGIVTNPTLAMIGERGPEAVIPLNRLGMMGGITVNVAGSVVAEDDLIETIRRGLVRSQRNGAQLVYSNV